MDLQTALNNFSSLVKRGLTTEVLEKYQVMFSSEGDLIVPLFSPTGIYVGNLVRTVSGEPKYRYEPEEANGYLYNYHRRPEGDLDVVIVQESPFDVYAVDPIYSVALVGVNADSLKMHCLAQLKARAYVVALDTDGPGIDAGFRTTNKLIKQGLTTILYQHGLKVKEDYEEIVEVAKNMRPGTLWIM